MYKWTESGISDSDHVGLYPDDFKWYHSSSGHVGLYPDDVEPCRNHTSMERLISARKLLSETISDIAWQ